MRRIAKYEAYRSVGGGINKSNLWINSCFLCNADRFHPGGRTVYLCQVKRWPTLMAHIGCYNAAINEMREQFPDNPFVESLG